MSRSKPRLITSFGLVLLPICGALAFFFFNFRMVQVTGDSMSPTLWNEERLLMTSAYWLVGDVKVGDVVVLKDPERGVYIKRVYAMPGDTVEPYLAPRRGWSLRQGDFKVPPGTIYVLGDNRPASEDSRDLGPIPREELLGKVLRWSWEAAP
jgi:signal peptidase I